MKLGARVFKTGIAIVLALFIANLLQLPSPVFAGIAAIFAIQPSIYRSFLTIVEQFQGNVVGAVIAVTFVLLFGNHLFIIGLAAIIVIGINLKLKIENTMGLSLVTLLVIMVSPGDDFFNFAVIRFSTVMLGVLSSFTVNLIFLPPKYEQKLYLKIASISEEITKWIRLIHASEHRLLKNDIQKIDNEIIELDELYLLYKEERNYFKRNNLEKMRKLVIYRHLISTTKNSLQTLKKLHRFEHELKVMPEQFQTEINEELDMLTTYHEQLLLRFLGKIKSPLHEQAEQPFHKRDLFYLLRDYEEKMVSHDDYILYHMMQLISIMSEYGEDIEHLDRLISSFMAYHQEDDKVVIPEEEEHI